jgi:autotransporter translocation and assembly factor TamB
VTPRRRRLNRVALFAAGTLLGVVLAAVAIQLFVDRMRTRLVAEQVRVELGLPAEFFEVERIEDDRSLRILLRQVAFMDEAGDTVLTAPVVRGRLLASSMSGAGPVVVDDVVVQEPFLRLLQRRDGTWNFLDIFRAEVDGRALAMEDEPGRAFEFRDVRIVDGRARIATPWDPPVRFAGQEQPERVQFAGAWFEIRRLNEVQARLDRIRINPEGGWRVEIADFTADVVNPDTRIQRLAGWVEQLPDETLRFDIDEFRTPFSRFAAAGRVRFEDGVPPVFDVVATADPLDFRDLVGMGVPVPSEGTARFRLAAESLSGARTRWVFTDAMVEALDSRVAGRLAVVTGPGEPVFSDTRLSLEPVQLADLEALGLVEDLPLLGTVTGTIASGDEFTAEAGGPLRLDLAAALVPRDEPGAAPSIVRADGLVALTGGDPAVRLDGVRIEAEPLRLAHLRALAPEQAELLRGEVNGVVTVSGTPNALTVDAGTLAYTVGDAPPSVVRGLRGTIRLQPSLAYDVALTADPLALGTLTELFPALPFRAATLSGPVRLSGTAERARFSFDLDGPSGALAMQGSVAFTDPARFDVSGRLEAFRPAALLTSGVPLEGPMTGTFSASGTTRDMRFAVDLQQALGRFALAGTVRRPGDDPPVFDVAGRLDDFNLGLLVGRADLLPGPVSGPIRVAGGGRQPYRFDVALAGEAGLLDVRGTYLAAEVPSYTVAGRVQRLNLGAIPLLRALPDTDLTATVSVDARGLTPETFAGRVEVDVVPGSLVGGIPLQAGLLRADARAGVLRVDTLALAIRGARLEASGPIGLTRAADGVMRFELDAPNLAALAAILPPPGGFQPAMAGALLASGWVGGTLRQPEIAAAVRGRELRYEDWRAGELAGDVRLLRGAEAWTGSVNLEGRRLVLAGESLELMRLEANLADDLATFGVFARRDSDTDLDAAGILELDGLAVQGAIFNRLRLRLGGEEWRLGVDRARVALTADGGLAVENLLLERTGDVPGIIEADGVLPGAGLANLRLRATNVQMDDVRRLYPALPELGGELTIEGVVEGPVTDPRIAVDVRVDRLAYEGVVAELVTLTGRYQAGAMALDGTVLYEGRSVLTFDGTVPMNVTLGGFVPGISMPDDGPLALQLRADSLPVALVAAAVPALRDGTGVARAYVDVGGTIGSPRVTGSADLYGGAFTVVPLGVRWTDVAGAVRLEGQSIVVDSISARTPNTFGHARVTGDVLLDQGTQPLMNLNVFMNNFEAMDRDDVAEVQVSANVQLTGRLPDAALTGNVTIVEGTFHIPELGADAEQDILEIDIGAIGADTVSTQVVNGGPFALFSPRDLSVTFGESVWLDSDDARIQIGGEVLVNEVGGSPVISGTLTTRRGTYTLEVGPIRREFEIVEGEIVFFGTTDLNPALRILAEHRVRRREPGVRDIVIQVNLGGTMNNPTVALTSDVRPALPESDLLSLLIFGRQTTDLGLLPEDVFQAVVFDQFIGGYLTRELEEFLVGLGIFDWVRLRSRPSSVGVSSVAGFGTDLLAYASLEAGREVFSGFFVILEIAQLLRNPQPGVSIEWEFANTWSLRAALEPARVDPLLPVLERGRYQGSVDVRRRWEYGYPRVDDELPPPPRRDADPPPAQPAPATPGSAPLPDG